MHALVLAVAPFAGCTADKPWGGDPPVVSTFDLLVAVTNSITDEGITALPRRMLQPCLMVAASLPADEIRRAVPASTVTDN